MEILIEKQEKEIIDNIKEIDGFKKAHDKMYVENCELFNNNNKLEAILDKTGILIEKQKKKLEKEGEKSDLLYCKIFIGKDSPVLFPIWKRVVASKVLGVVEGLEKKIQDLTALVEKERGETTMRAIPELEKEEDHNLEDDDSSEKSELIVDENLQMEEEEEEEGEEEEEEEDDDDDDDEDEEEEEEKEDDDDGN
ncbi:eukaryotic translation initiation factor 5B-like [Palaemon carinicauda]|uniref:eukaryotic translation initiation factor 5B-like n=1 Tax=Palaemon carinicauda TaxID=392227 RepID=UPI0035B60C40